MQEALDCISSTECICVCVCVHAHVCACAAGARCGGVERELCSGKALRFHSLAQSAKEILQIENLKLNLSEARPRTRKISIWAGKAGVYTQDYTQSSRRNRVNGTEQFSPNQSYVKSFKLLVF